MLKNRKLRIFIIIFIIAIIILVFSLLCKNYNSEDENEPKKSINSRLQEIVTNMSSFKDKNLENKQFYDKILNRIHTIINIIEEENDIPEEQAFQIKLSTLEEYTKKINDKKLSAESYEHELQKKVDDIFICVIFLLKNNELKTSKLDEYNLEEEMSTNN
ncbi:hypothetical protein DMUE_1328 [Dictyocoela muelleri]|nr:hypothetical protein DMUE_1328 [Dictyocoela muelleri]